MFVTICGIVIAVLIIVEIIIEIRSSKIALYSFCNTIVCVWLLFSNDDFVIINNGFFKILIGLMVLWGTIVVAKAINIFGKDKI